MGALIESRVFSFFFSFLSLLNNSHKYALLEIVSSRIKKCDEEVHFTNKRKVDDQLEMFFCRKCTEFLKN